MQIGTKVKIKWNGKTGEVIKSEPIRTEKSPNLIAQYLVKLEDGSTDYFKRDEIRILS